MVSVQGYKRKDGTYVRPHYRRESTNHYVAQRIQDPRKFDPRSFRTVKRDGTLIIVACPAGEYKKGRCQVGMQTQSIRKLKERGGK